jgi:CRISPR system Cascade subunit CasA
MDSKHERFSGEKMAYSVLTEPWLPVRLADGSFRRIAPWQVADPAIVDISHPRPDLTGAARELVIGLLQALYPPADSEERDERIMLPPSADDLRRVFEARADLFELIDGPSRFLQDHGGVPGDDIRPLDSLPLNGPGEQTRKLLKDFFIRRDLTERACPECVVLLLAAKQFYASGAGSGFRVSPRGGGPLTTLVEFTNEAGDPAPLWHSLYANVLPLEVIGGTGLTDQNAPRVLPWLAPLRVSKAGKSEVLTTLDHANILQVYFPSACRAEIVWQNGDACECDVCGSIFPARAGVYRVVATGWKTAQYGVKYAGLIHPLTPYRQDKESGLISLKPKLSGISYLDWMAIVLGSEGNSTPATTIQQIKDSLVLFTGLIPRMRAYGYQLDNASALAWHEAVIPFVDVPEENRRDFAIEVGLMVDAARQFGSLLEEHVKLGLYGVPDKKKVGEYKMAASLSGDISHIRRELISSTSFQFYDALPRLVAGLGSNNLLEVKTSWLKLLRQHSLRLFDRHAPLHLADERDLERLVLVRRKFEMMIGSSWAKKLLNLPVSKKEKIDA